METEKYIEHLHSCALCGHKCKVDRLSGELGECRSGPEIRISSFGPHYGEEPELVGHFGSGTIFLSNCNLSCVFCQNADISHQGIGVKIERDGLVKVMLDLQKRGCHNINWVSPTHLTPLLLPALEIARNEGLDIPLVYNTGGYDSLENLQMLDGWAGIYMPDAKYGDSAAAYKYSGAPGYWEVCRQGLKEMHRQVGDLLVQNGTAAKGLLVRHLVLPEDIASSMEVFEFIAEEISTNTYINIMDQYRPCHNAREFPELDRRLSQNEFKAAAMLAESFGLHRGFMNYW
ncbi:MAG: radical SAM protein [candidate division Zixibacteria bacterium]|nr:radical SAM protein [Candidatus Tariuqbacter arcticus]